MSPLAIARALVEAGRRVDEARDTAARAGHRYVHARRLDPVEAQVVAFGELDESVKRWSAAEGKLQSLASAAELVRSRDWERRCACGGRFTRRAPGWPRHCGSCCAWEPRPCFSCGGEIGAEHTIANAWRRTAAEPSHVSVCEPCYRKATGA